MTYKSAKYTVFGYDDQRPKEVEGTALGVVGVHKTQEWHAHQGVFVSLKETPGYTVDIYILTHVPTGLSIAQSVNRRHIQELGRLVEPLLPRDGTLGKAPPVDQLQEVKKVVEDWVERHGYMTRWGGSNV